MPTFLKPGQGTDTSFRDLVVPSTIVLEEHPKLEAIIIITAAPRSGKSSLMTDMVAEAVASTIAVEKHTGIVVKAEWSGQPLKRLVLDDSATGLPGWSNIAVTSTSQPDWGVIWYDPGNIQRHNGSLLVEESHELIHLPHRNWYGDDSLAIDFAKMLPQVSIEHDDFVEAPRDQPRPVVDQAHSDPLGTPNVVPPHRQISSSLYERLFSECRFFLNTIMEALVHPLSTSVIDKHDGRLVSRRRGD